MNNLLYVLLGICFISFASILTWLLVIIFKEKEKNLDNPIALNFLAKRDVGSFLAIEEEVTMGKNGRYNIKCTPCDLSVNHKDKIEPFNVIVDHNKKLTIPKGDLSKARNINIYLPANLDDMPTSIKDTAFGQSFVFMTMLQEVQTTVETILREGTMRRDLLLKKIGDGEISKEFIQVQEGLIKDYLEKVVSNRDKERQAMQYTPPSQIGVAH